MYSVTHPANKTRDWTLLHHINEFDWDELGPTPSPRMLGLLELISPCVFLK